MKASSKNCGYGLLITCILTVLNGLAFAEVPNLKTMETNNSNPLPLNTQLKTHGQPKGLNAHQQQAHDNNQTQNFLASRDSFPYSPYGDRPIIMVSKIAIPNESLTEHLFTGTVNLTKNPLMKASVHDFIEKSYGLNTNDLNEQHRAALTNLQAWQEKTLSEEKRKTALTALPEKTFDAIKAAIHSHYPESHPNAPWRYLEHYGVNGLRLTELSPHYFIKRDGTIINYLSQDHKVPTDHYAPGIESKKLKALKEDIDSHEAISRIHNGESLTVDSTRYIAGYFAYPPVFDKDGKIDPKRSTLGQTPIGNPFVKGVIIESEAHQLPSSEQINALRHIILEKENTAIAISHPYGAYDPKTGKVNRTEGLITHLGLTEALRDQQHPLGHLVTEIHEDHHYVVNPTQIPGKLSVADLQEINRHDTRQLHVKK